MLLRSRETECPALTAPNSVDGPLGAQSSDGLVALDQFRFGKCTDAGVLPPVRESFPAMPRKELFQGPACTLTGRPTTLGCCPKRVYPGLEFLELGLTLASRLAVIVRQDVPVSLVGKVRLPRTEPIAKHRDPFESAHRACKQGITCTDVALHKACECFQEGWFTFGVARRTPGLVCYSEPGVVVHVLEPIDWSGQEYGIAND